MPPFVHAANTNPWCAHTGVLTGDNGAYPPYVYGLISTGAVVLVILAAILVALILHRVYLRITETKNRNRLRRLRGDTPSQHSDTYDDTLSFPESVQQSSLQNSDTRDTGVMMTCNADISDGKRSHSSYTSNTDHSKAKSADDGPDYENLVCSYHLFGDNVQPEFVTTPNLAKVGRTFKSMAYSELKDYPHSGNVATSRSPSNIHDHRKEEDQFELSKQRSREKAERFK